MSRLLSFCLVVALAVMPVMVGAHSLSFLEGEVVVHPDRVEVKLNVLSADILLSAGMTMIVLDKIDKADVVKGIEAHRKYLLNGLVILDAAGHRLAGKITKVESPVVPDDGITLETLTASTFVYRLEYPLAKPPEKLGFCQTFNTESNPIPVSVQFSVTREGQDSGVTIPIPAGDTPETVEFQWAAAAASATASKPAALEASDVFLYIQNDEIRAEILMPLPVIETWLPVPRQVPEFLDVSEQTALQGTLGKFFTEHNLLRIDGVAVKPKLDRVDFFGIEFKDFALRPQPQRLSAATARVGVILSYSTKGAPRQVQWTWTLFKDRATAVRGTLFSFDKGSRFALSPDKPVIEWVNPGVPPLPKIESVLTQRGAGDDKARAVLAETLLRNVYRGFDYHNESDVYDALAQSVQGDLLTELYLKIKQGLIVQEQGGAVARVQEVALVGAEPASATIEDGFSERVTWQVTGTVEHWGHIHTRVNEYTADVGIARTSGAWKIVSLSVARQSQVKSVMSVRKL